MLAIKPQSHSEASMSLMRLAVPRGKLADCVQKPHWDTYTLKYCIRNSMDAFNTAVFLKVC